MAICITTISGQSSGNDLFPFYDVGGSKYGYMDRGGQIVIPARFEDVGNFSEGLAPVRFNNKWAYIRTDGSLVFRRTFAEARGFSDGLAAVRIGNKWGYIDRTGSVRIKPIFKFAGDFHDGLAQFATSGSSRHYIFIGKRGFID
ncbi:WG repeat-containing protein, partial [Vibrio sp. 2033]|nr:WG repeat-containing protein [Vibrio sp. 2033]